MQKSVSTSCLAAGKKLGQIHFLNVLILMLAHVPFLHSLRLRVFFRFTSIYIVNMKD